MALAELWLLLGDMERASKFIERCMSLPSGGPAFSHAEYRNVGKLAAHVQGTPPEAPFADPRPKLFAPEGAERVAVVFSGLGTGIAAVSAYFAPTMAQMGYATLVVPDLHHSLHVIGLEGGVSSWRSTTRILRKGLRAANLTPDLVVGVSYGGYVALRAAAALQARCYVGFSVVTTMDPDTWRLYERRGRLLLSRLSRKHGGELIDLRRMHLGKGMAIDLVYGAQNRMDRLNAENMADRPGVRLVPFETDGHRTWEEMFYADRLTETLKAALDR
jgi:hypothetical protein